MQAQPIPDPEFPMQEQQQAKSVWLGKLSLLLISSALSSVIGAATVCIGWKASIDTLNAVTQVKIEESAARVQLLEQTTVRQSDMVYRDQLLDSKLQLLSNKISALDDKVSELSAGRRR